MTGDDLSELLSSIDEPAFPPDDAKARVWERIRDDLSPTTHLAGTRPANGEVVVAIGPKIERKATPRASRGQRMAFAAATIAVLVSGVLVLNDQNQQDHVATDQTPVSGPASIRVLNDPTAACERFVAEVGPLLSLEEWVDTKAPEGAATLEAAATALDQLRVDFGAANQTNPSALADIAQIAGGLRQAADHLLSDEQRQASASFDFAERTYADGPLADTDCLG